MKIEIFQSSKGDCLLLEANDGARILCDGGMHDSMRGVVRKELAKLRTRNIKIDYVYVSHIDQDHISGVLALLEDELEWRLYDHHKAKGTPKPKPKVPRPPEIGGIWHNAFRDQVGQNADKVEELLAASAATLLATGDAELRGLGIVYQEIALSIPEALKVSRLASADLLKIPTNQLPGAQGPAKLLMMRRDQQSIPVGSMILTIVGPGTKELEALKKGWNTWLESTDGHAGLARVRREIKEKLDGVSDLTTVGSRWNGIAPYKGVTAPNIASLMFMVEENGKRLLLTGDSQQDFILAGLEQTGFLEGGSIHLDVLKVQHHASEYNLDENFAKHVSADHYIFCGNGENGNPELSVIDLIYQSRLGKAAQRTLNPAAEGRKFKFWFSTTSSAQEPGSDEQKTYAAVEAHIAQLVQQSNGTLSAAFNPGASITLKV
ncbi:MBL fold metallo-hydrolase [Novosphingobium sp. G106]|uniref:MBL fold metallo-hydrolase n=1 Tax=Novosphingobium sp. G106 TaxID=2849500 RepID=UPI001C2D81E1|nr:MBL fold metallo-hydrolase [Novosphingobium sp. G106]MBV1686352.1 MBL fold metallo-hydrolase [Novosphingobium sp. G106]